VSETANAGMGFLRAWSNYDSRMEERFALSKQYLGLRSLENSLQMGSGDICFW
jgi:hypothetical protein